MSAHLSRIAEERELEKKRAELATLVEVLSGREAELAALQAGLRDFESRYLRIIGARYAELDEIESRIDAVEGRSRGGGGGGDTSWTVDEQVGCGPARFQATEKLKKLYREVARKFHPDLGADELEREHRHRLMVEVNRAYEAGSEERLAALLAAQSWCAELVGGAGVSVELARLVREIAQARERLSEIADKIAAIGGLEIYRLKLRAERAEAQGRNFLAELVAQIEAQIAKARNRLFHLQGEGPVASWGGATDKHGKITD